MISQKDIGDASVIPPDTDIPALNDTQRKILTLLSRDAQLSASRMAEEIGISRRNVEMNIKKLKEQGFLIRHGSPKSGYWEIEREVKFSSK